jgi:GntR family transcriptional regulator, vanillate catabolism transcriptional regulator
MGLREMVLRGEFRAGARIAEVPVGQKLNVSRTPVRHALERLVEEGLLEANASGGFTVREFTVRDIWDAIEARGVLEGAAARLAAERLTDFKEADPLRRLCKDLEEVVSASVANRQAPSSDEMSRFAELNGKFHTAIVELAKSPMLEWAIDRVQGIPFASPRAVIMSGTMEGSLIAQAQHRALLDAIVNREGARAEGIAREHARFARQNLERALVQTPDSAAAERSGLALIKNALPPGFKDAERRRAVPVAETADEDGNRQ